MLVKNSNLIAEIIPGILRRDNTSDHLFSNDRNHFGYT